MREAAASKFQFRVTDDFDRFRVETKETLSRHTEGIKQVAESSSENLAKLRQK